MNINDYLIAPSASDWSKLLSFWVPPLPATLTLWLVNKLGDAFVVTQNQTIVRLELGTGVCSEVASSREQFASLLDQPQKADAWLRIHLVNACRRSGMMLTQTQCYGFRVPPTLGGRYEVSNLTPMELIDHYSYQAYLCRQVDVYWIPPR
jgi:hypothetical protein